MKASVCVSDCIALNETQIQIKFHVSLSNGEFYETSENIGVSPSAATVNNAIKTRVVSSAVSYGGVGLQSSDITVFGGVS